ncbi:MFS transporter [Aureimonas altamirensis]|uniref:MFS transporter n=1 Tax=Aureimonas altamirensis TaxID=370622 RepID=UPI001E3E01EF|nr:MFS transporter [Aureimonas altamirensis]UHD46413.1 MFS transporter [Aureimonas altamirensis]
MTAASQAAVVLTRRQSSILAVVLTAYFMILLDLSIVYTGLPDIGASMALEPIALSWVQNAYLLCFGGFLLLSARLGDAFGRKRMFQLGIVLFTLASMVIGLAQTAWELIAARAVQGVAASIIAPMVLSIITDTFAEGRERTKALSLYSMVAGFGVSLGMVLGGIFAGVVSWRVGFLINLPIGIGLWLAVGRIIEETDRVAGRFDVLGSALSTIGIAALVYGIVNSAAYGWTNPLTVTPLIGALVILTVFVLAQGRVASPILPLRLFASAERSAAYIARMLVVGAIVAFFYFTTQFLQQVLGYSPLWAGLAFLPMTIPTFFAAVAVPQMTRAIGQIGVLVLATFSIGTGLLWLAQASGENYWLEIALPMVLLGIGNGAALPPLTTFALWNVDRAEQGAASGMVNVAHQIGGSLGLSLLVLVFAAASQPDLSGSALLAHRIEAALAGAGIMSLTAMALALVVLAPRHYRSSRPVH